MTISRFLTWVMMGVAVPYGVWISVTEPMVWRLPPLASPSLSSQATEPVSRLGPDGLQSTIAENGK